MGAFSSRSRITDAEECLDESNGRARHHFVDARDGSSGRKRQRTKRKRSSSNLEEEEACGVDYGLPLRMEGYEDEEFDEILHTPKKRKLRTTSRYIYETLFIGSKDSDITVVALGREWKLHKLYLSQSMYFRSMFSGSWLESSMERIELQVVDPNVTLDALHIALGSLYQDEIIVEAAEVTAILAAANILQLDGLIDQCVAIMEETINGKTVVQYYETSLMYGAISIKNSCLAWLKVNLLSHMDEYPSSLREIPPSLMASLVRSPDLYVIMTEFSVYVLLRLWLFLRFRPEWSGSRHDAVLMSHNFFQERVGRDRNFFLDTPDGKEYIEAFRSLRLQHLVNHHMDMEMLLNDKIIPKSWMYPMYQKLWQLLLKMDQGIDKGPQTLSKSDFDKFSLRCGRTLDAPGQHMWRWTGFNMGLDLIITFYQGNISVKRNVPTIYEEHEALLSNHRKRHIYFRVSVASLNEQNQVVFSACSPVDSATLGRNTSHPMLKVDMAKASFPLLLSFNFFTNSFLPIEEDERHEEEQPKSQEEEEEAAVRDDNSANHYRHFGRELVEANENGDSDRNVQELRPA